MLSFDAAFLSGHYASLSSLFAALFVLFDLFSVASALAASFQAFHWAILCCKVGAREEAEWGSLGHLEMGT